MGQASGWLQKLTAICPGWIVAALAFPGGKNTYL
jgi:hypothetical protein